MNNLLSYILLYRYVPPLTSSSPKLPDTPEEIQKELCKQESLLNQIHSEMNAGYVSKKREEQLWEVQRIITQLKRKLKSFEKKSEKSMDETETGTDTIDAAAIKLNSNKATLVKSESGGGGSLETLKLHKSLTLEISDTTKSPKNKNNKDSLNAVTDTNNKSTEESSSATSPLIHNTNNSDDLYIDNDTGLLMISKSHPDYSTLLRLQLENQELLAWKSQLQARISTERAEILQLKQLLQHQIKNKNIPQEQVISPLPGTEDYERIVDHFMRENEMLEKKKQMLAKEIFEENKQCIALQVELAMQKY